MHAPQYDAETTAVRTALDAILDKADEMGPLFATLSSALAAGKQGVNALMRQDAAIGQGRLNSVQAVHQRHRCLEAAIRAFEQGIEGLYDHRRVLTEAHASMVNTLKTEVDAVTPTP